MTFGQQNSELNNPLPYCGDTETDRTRDTCIYIEKYCDTFLPFVSELLGA